MNKHRKGELILLLVSLAWGSSYFLSKVAFDYVGPITMISQRFIIGFFASLLLLRKNFKRISDQDLKQSLFLGLSLFSALMFATYGVKYTTASNAGFLSCLNIIFIPIICAFIFKQKLSKKVIIAVIMCFIGVYLLSVQGSFSINFGDFLCIIAAMSFTLNIMLADRYSKKSNPIKIGTLQLGVVAIISTIIAPIIEDYSFATDIVGIFTILFLGLVCTAGCYVMQIYAQSRLNAIESGLILATEPLFAAMFAFIVLGEVLTIKSYFGGILILISVIIGGIL